MLCIYSIYYMHVYNIIANWTERYTTTANFVYVYVCKFLALVTFYSLQGAEDDQSVCARELTQINIHTYTQAACVRMRNT